MIWDGPWTSAGDLHLVALGIIGRFVVFGFVLQGLDQIRTELMALPQACALPAALSKIPKLFQLVGLSEEARGAETA
jgi:hypothetical protein